MSKTYPDQTRNLNPTPEARVAMIVWGREYSQQEAGRGLGSLRNDLYSHPCYQAQAQRYLDRVLAALSKEADGG